MAQRYFRSIALDRMSKGLCPECGGAPEKHYETGHFWDPWMVRCPLYRRGVTERIEQYRTDLKEKTS